jgi:transcriptional regulator with XRE-family HTH domain
MSDSLIDRRKLRQRRIRAGLNRSELAGRVQKSVSHISGIERGDFGVSEKTLHALARALGCDIDDLMPDDEMAA